MPENKLCHCGKPLHYTSPAIQASVERIIAERGERVQVSARGRTWLVRQDTTSPCTDCRKSIYQR